MADSNAPGHQDRALFGLLGKKKEDETHQQHSSAVDPHGHGHVGDVHHAAPPPPVSHVRFEESKLHGTNSSSSSYSSDDEEGGEKGEKKKNKGGFREKLPRHKIKGRKENGVKKQGLMYKVKQKLPGQYNKEEEKSNSA